MAPIVLCTVPAAPERPLPARCAGSGVSGEPVGVGTGTGLLAFLDQGVRLLGGALNGSLRQKRVEGRYTNDWRSSGRRTPRASDRDFTTRDV